MRAIVPAGPIFSTTRKRRPPRKPLTPPTATHRIRGLRQHDQEPEPVNPLRGRLRLDRPRPPLQTSNCSGLSSEVQCSDSVLGFPTTEPTADSFGDHLRVLIANEKLDRLGLLAAVVEGLGHEVIARSVSVKEVAATTARERPDVALVGLGESSEHALELISEIVREAYCPVIAILSAYDAPWVNEAAKRGVFAYIIDGHPEELQSAIDITLRRFADVQSLQEAIERRNAEALREQEIARARQRQALELHDGVVQGLVAAQLAHDLGREGESHEALLDALERAKAVVGRSLEELKSTGVSTEQLIRDTASHG